MISSLAWKRVRPHHKIIMALVPGDSMAGRSAIRQMISFAWSLVESLVFPARSQDANCDVQDGLCQSCRSFIRKGPQEDQGPPPWLFRERFRRPLKSVDGGCSLCRIIAYEISQTFDESERSRFSRSFGYGDYLEGIYDNDDESTGSQRKHFSIDFHNDACKPMLRLKLGPLHGKEYSLYICFMVLVKLT